MRFGLKGIEQDVPRVVWGLGQSCGSDGSFRAPWDSAVPSARDPIDLVLILVGCPPVAHVQKLQGSFRAPTVLPMHQGAAQSHVAPVSVLMLRAAPLWHTLRS